MRLNFARAVWRAFASARMVFGVFVARTVITSLTPTICSVPRRVPIFLSKARVQVGADRDPRTRGRYSRRREKAMHPIQHQDRQHAWSGGSCFATGKAASSPTSRRPENPRPGPSSSPRFQDRRTVDRRQRHLGHYAQRWQIEKNPWLQPRRHPHPISKLITFWTKSAIGSTRPSRSASRIPSSDTVSVDKGQLVNRHSSH